MERSGVSIQWDAGLYGANSAHHRSFDAGFLDTLEIRPHSSILDVGCGTGDLAARLAELALHGQVVGIDASSSMVNEARRCHPRLRFVECAAQDITPDIGTFDLAVSTAVLHWIPETDHPEVLRRVHGVLRPGGVFRAEFGGQGQIARARQILDETARDMALDVTPPWYFPAPEAYKQRLVAAGFSEARSWTALRHQRRSVPDEDALRGWLRSQVLIAYEASMTERDAAEFRQRVESRARVELRRDDGTYDQDYVRLDLLAVVDAPDSGD
ncbi:MAG: methyltransferase domain-containing protein [Candidatus Dormiibacterota bacterium]